MSLLHDLVQEMAAAGSTSANSIASAPGSLFGGGIVDTKKKQKTKKTPIFRRITGLAESLGVNSGTTNFDASDVISKIDAASKKESDADDTTPFGLEDEDGNMVKVYVRNDQAEDFEKQLAALLAGADEDDDEENSSLEIAEVLFKLKDKFDIVDVEWPGIEGDVEEEQEVAGDPAAGAPMGEQPAGAGMDAAGDGLDGLDPTQDEEGGEGADEMAPDDSGAESALNQVIDMMKADAEAKKAEANAREAEARAKEAEYTAQAAAGKVRKEEQMFDMESAEKKKKEQEKESQQMSKLARFQHEKAQDAEVKLSMEGKADDESSDPWVTNDTDIDDDDELTLKELSTLIMRNLRHN